MAGEKFKNRGLYIMCIIVHQKCNSPARRRVDGLRQTASPL